MKKQIPIFCSILLFIISISCFEKGYTNQYGLYTPKKANFKLKDKPFVFSTKLDTTNIYKLIFESYLGKTEFSLKDNIWHSDNLFSRELDFIKFYSKGRYSNFRIRTKLGDKIGVSLAENDLNPDFHTHGYYYLDGKKIQTESFVYREGYGRYLYFNYHLSNSGDTLIRIYDKSKSIYVREKIPVTWKKYSINW